MDGPVGCLNIFQALLPTDLTGSCLPGCVDNVDGVEITHRFQALHRNDTIIDDGVNLGGSMGHREVTGHANDSRHHRKSENSSDQPCLNGLQHRIPLTVTLAITNVKPIAEVLLRCRFG